GIASPQDVSVIGFDDGIIAKYLSPKLTTVRYPINIMAEQAAQLSVQLAKGEKSNEYPRMFVPTLVRRRSVL
ncbi:substrate-binding domain-containing protein, partial [Photobacterium sanctipauli]